MKYGGVTIALLPENKRILVDVNKDNNLLIFLHIVKAGGTTLRWVLEDQFSCRRILRCYAAHGSTLEDVAAIPEEKRRQLRLFISHYGFGAHKLFPQRASYITMLREPISRSVSQYYAFINGRPDIEKYHDMHSLEDYVSNMAVAGFDNTQVRFIAGARDAGEITSKHLDAAMANITESFSAIGITERFEESLVLFGKIYGWKHLSYVRRNVTTSKPADLQLGTDLLKTLREHNRLDIELCKFANERFESLLREHNVGEKDAEELLSNSSGARMRLYMSRIVRKLQRKVMGLR